MYRLVFDNYLDHLMRHRGAARRQAALWYPDRGTAEQAAGRMRALGQKVSIEAMDSTLGALRPRPGAEAAPGGPLVTPEEY